MYFGVRSALCLAILFAASLASLADTPVDLKKTYAQAKAGDAESMCEMARFSLEGTVIPKDLKASYDWAAAGAKLDAARCIAILAAYTFDGVIVPKDESLALDLFKKSADFGYFEAQYDLGEIYLNGLAGQARNAATAKDWYARAAAQGHAQSQERLAFLLLYGDEGVSTDKPAAFTWFQAAARQGLPISQTITGEMLAYGTGTAKDPAQAVSWWHQAARQGEAQAQVDLGIAYLNGNGAKRIPDLGITWLEKAASQGEAKRKDAGNAHKALAQVYEKGIGVPINAALARSHWNRAAKLGVPGALEARDRIDQAEREAKAKTASTEHELTGGEVLGGLIVMGIIGALASGGGSGSQSDCDLPSYTQNWSKAAKNYECYQRRANAAFDAQREQQQKENDWLGSMMLLENGN